jgi:Raf kinase inhibitor-like YbhB/YbcL family protein
MAFAIASPAFSEGDTIPIEFTCEGTGGPPPIELRNPPREARSYAVIMDDPDAPHGVFTHWLAFDIPPGEARLQGGRGKTLPNSFGRPGYGGPCPPRGHGPHRYYLTVYAVDVPALSVAGQSRQDLERALDGHVLAEARLMGRYERKR